MSKQKPQIVQAFSSAEGVVIGRVREKFSGGVGLDMTGAPVPDRRFAADAAWVDIGTDMARIIFAQFKAAGPDIEHVVVLRVAFDGVRNMVRSMSGEVAPLGNAFLEKNKVAPSPEVNKNSLPNQTFTLDANIIISGFSGREACLDLYHASPHAKLALMHGSKEYRGEPVARVILTTRLMMEIHDALAAKMDTLPVDQEVINQ